ncbi:MAG: alpha-hydroxy-acid oxidizing protein [Cyclobacteriaceae bacterium]
MSWYDRQYPGIDDLRNRAKQKVPKFAFEYLDGGCNEDVNLVKNTTEIRAVEMIPQYLKDHQPADLSTQLFGETYSAPFGIAPIGLQGLIWPGASQILAAAAQRHNIPFVLSTVTTMDIEEACELTEGKAWFQLYHPAKEELRDDLLKRAQAAGCQVLVLLCDVPVFGFRPRDIRNGLAMPPKMSLRNFAQITQRPDWAFQTLIKGQPQFESLKPYMPKGLDMSQLGAFMDETFSGRLSDERVATIRDKWKGKIVLKGVASVEDAQRAHELGLDGIIVSNHGGRQLDAGQSTIAPLKKIAALYGDKLTVMMDSGIRSGPDIARSIASGAQFTFLGRTFMYSVGALGNKGGDHAIGLLKTQLEQVLEQLCCPKPEDLPEFLVK